MSKYLIMFTISLAFCNIVRINSESTNQYIECDYKWYKFDEKNNYYNLQTCRVANEVKIDKEDSTVAIFKYLKSKFVFDNSTVEGFEALDKEIYYLPINIGTYFKYLKALQIRRSKMKKISSNDLKTYENLEFLDLSNNNIQILEENLFQHNLKLEIIWLNNNWIFDIHAKAFDGLNQVSFINLNRNICYSGIARKNEVENALKKTSSTNILEILVYITKAKHKLEDEWTKEIEKNCNVSEILKLSLGDNVPTSEISQDDLTQEIQPYVNDKNETNSNDKPKCESKSSFNEANSDNSQDNMLVVGKPVAICVLVLITALLLIILMMFVYIKYKIRNLNPESSHHSSFVPKLPSTAVNHPKINEISIKSMNMSLQDDEKPERIYQSKPNIYEMANESKEEALYSSPIEEDLYADIEIKNKSDEDKELYAVVYKK